MTAGTFDLPPADGAYDPLDPANNSPVVVALCADGAQAITGQVFHIFGGAVDMLRPWSPGERFEKKSQWEAAELLSELLARVDGARPEPLGEAIRKVGGEYVVKS